MSFSPSTAVKDAKVKSRTKRIAVKKYFMIQRSMKLDERALGLGRQRNDQFSIAFYTPKQVSS